jgi:hypothetical protein
MKKCIYCGSSNTEKDISYANGASLRECVPTLSHWAASAAKEKGSDGPVRRHRKTGMLSETPCFCSL